MYFQRSRFWREELVKAQFNAPRRREPIEVEALPVTQLALDAISFRVAAYENTSEDESCSSTQPE